MGFFGVFLFCSAMFMLICLAVAVRAQILCRNEIYAYQQQAIVVMKENLDTAERERGVFKCDLDRANQTIADMMSDLSIVRNERHGVVEELEKAVKERDELREQIHQMSSSSISEIERITKERDEYKALAKEIKDDRIRDGICGIAKKVELREKLEIVKAEIDNIITIDLEEK